MKDENVGRPPRAAAGPLAGFVYLSEFGRPGQGARRGPGGPPHIYRGANGSGSHTIRSLTVAVLLLAAAGRAEIIDRVAAVVGRQVITQSEVDRETRLERFFGAASPDPKQVLQRLIRQRLVFQELEQTALPELTGEELDEWLATARPAGADPARHGLKPPDPIEYGRRQLQIEKFLDLRFKTGFQVSEQEIETYYKTRLRPEMERRGVQPIPALEAVRDRVEKAVTEERVNQLMEEWMNELRQRTKVRLADQAPP